MPLALPASPRPSPPVSMCGAGGGLCFALAGAAPASACPPHGCPESPRLGVGGGFRVPRMRTVCAASGGCPRLIGLAKITGHSVTMSTKFPGGCARRRFWLTVRLLSTRPRNCLLRTQQNQACCCVRLPPVRVYPTLILGTFATHEGRLFGFYPAERNKTQCYFVAFIVG